LSINHLLFALIRFSFGPTSSNNGLECTTSFCFGSRGYIHQQQTSHVADPRSFKEQTIVHSRPYPTSMLIQVHIQPNNNDDISKEYFVKITDNKYQTTEQSYTFIKPGNHTLIFQNVMAVSILASTKTLFNLHFYVMEKEESDCIEMEIQNAKCFLNHKCKEASVQCIEFTEMENDAEPTFRISAVELGIPKMHPRRTSKIWWYIFRSGCDNFQHLVQSKSGVYRNNPDDDKETWLSLIRLSYYCNNKFSCKAFGPCTQTCNFVRSIKRLRALIGYDICDPFSDSHKLSMF